MTPWPAADQSVPAASLPIPQRSRLRRYAAVLVLTGTVAAVRRPPSVPAADTANRQLSDVETISPTDRYDKYPTLARTVDGTPFIAFVAHANGRDRLLVRARTATGWGRENTVDSLSGAVATPRLAVTRDGVLHLVWTARRGGKWRLVRRTRTPRGWSREQVLTSGDGDAMHPALAVDQEGNAWLAWDSWTPGASRVRVARLNAGGLGAAHTIDEGGVNFSLDRRPALTVAAGGGMWLGWTSMRTGNDDIWIARLEPGASASAEPVAGRAIAATRDATIDDAVSLTTTRDGSLWLAWTAMRSHRTAGSMAERRSGDAFVRVLRNGRWLAPAAPVAGDAPGQVSHDAVDKGSLTVEDPEWHWRQTQNYPVLTRDGKDRVWVLWRTDATGAHNFDLRARVHDGTRWSDELDLTPFSPGRDEWPTAIASGDGGLLLAWEGQQYAGWTAPPESREGFVDTFDSRAQPNAVFTAQVRAPIFAAGVLAPLQAVDVSAEVATVDPDVRASRPRGAADTVRGGWSVYFADLHTHTILSDGKTGFAEQLFAIGRDQRGMDIVAVTDHAEMGVLQANEWRENLAIARAFDAPGRFVAMVGWEWTGGPATGHRIVLPDSADRIHPLSSATPAGAPVDSLYRVMRRIGAVTSAHHSGQATWGRWNPAAPFDAELEPLFEIASWHGRFEFYGNPFEGRRQIPGHHWRDALALGRPLGASASSDAHFLNVADGGVTAVLANRLDRRDVMQALRARRTYATTGAPIMVDVLADRVPNTATPSAPTTVGGTLVTDRQVHLSVRVRGTAAIDRLEIMRDGTPWWALVRTERTSDGNGAVWAVYDPAAPQRVLFQRSADARATTIDVQEMVPAGQTVRYDVRITQADGEQAWTSPISVTRSASGARR